MKKIIVLISLFFLLSLVSKSYAQTFGIRVGLNFPSWLERDYERIYSYNKLKLGFHIGGVIELPVTEALSLEGNLLLSLKGGKSVLSLEENVGIVKNININNVFYIDIPINVKYHFNIGSTKLYGLAGPYLGIGMVGKNKYTREWDDDKNTTSNEYEWGEDEDLKRFDAGLTLGAGVTLGSIEIGMFYELGLMNISGVTFDGYKIKNRNLGLSVIYFFGKK